MQHAGSTLNWSGSTNEREDQWCIWMRHGVKPITQFPAVGMTCYDGQGGLPVPTGKGNSLIVSHACYDGVGGSF